MNVVNCAIKSSIALFAFSPLASASLITGDVNQQITGQGNYYVDLDGVSVNDLFDTCKSTNGHGENKSFGGKF